MTRRLRVLLVDDHAILREGLAVLINREPDMQVVAQAEDGRSAVDLAKSMAPDVVVLDISMPELNGAQALERMCEHCPGLRVLVLTRHADPGYLRRMLAAGASGYVLKKSAADSLIQAIRLVAAGQPYIEPSLGSALLQQTFAGEPADRAGLSLREQEVLHRIAWGRTNKEIASELAISVKTVESYKASATSKLGLRTRADLVQYAVARRWLSEDAPPQ